VCLQMFLEGLACSLIISSLAQIWHGIVEQAA
jgi:hypothetical protein